MRDLSLHILDIAENSINAGADKILIRIKEDVPKDILMIEVRDNGKGMDKETLLNASDPFFSTKKVRGNIGLGIPLLKQMAEECGGKVEIETGEGIGTSITASFRHGHIDRKPLGDIGSTISTLIYCHPAINFRYEHDRDGDIYSLDTEELREELGDVPLNSTEVIKFIKNSINSWLNNT
ncbi:MAG: ATP-binding protein [Thermodesulfovibrionia bacterium]|nr:ATP-binding protein [Thermodesulfovibrionia bacterium]